MKKQAMAAAPTTFYLTQIQRGQLWITKSWHKDEASAKDAARAYAKLYRVPARAMKVMPPEKNPVRSLPMSKNEMATIRRGAQKLLTGAGAAVRRAAKLYVNFTGHDDPHVQKIAIPDPPEAVAEVGLCDGILYTTIRDGKQEKYIHRFKNKSRPLLVASDDGTQLHLLGGAYDFTERGIVDR